MVEYPRSRCKDNNFRQDRINLAGSIVFYLFYLSPLQTSGMKLAVFLGVRTVPAWAASYLGNRCLKWCINRFEGRNGVIPTYLSRQVITLYRNKRNLPPVLMIPGFQGIQKTVLGRGINL